MTDEEIQEYEEKTERLAQECAKEKPKKKRVKRLMEATHVGRRAWVENELPSVSEVLEKFPPLKQPKHVSHLFIHMVSLSVFGVEEINTSFEKDYSLFSHTPHSFSIRYFLNDCIPSSIAPAVLTS